MGTPQDSEKTKAKLIESAGELFAEKGVNGVTVRDIARKANTPLGAISYHFKTKDALYREVLLEACKADSLSSKEREQLKALPPHTALFVFVSEAIQNYQNQKDSNWKSVVITRECWEPSQVFQEVADTFFLPHTDFLAHVIGEIVKKPSTDYYVRFAVITLIGLIDTFGLYGRLVESVAPGLISFLGKKNRLAKHISDLAIQAAKEEVRR